MFQLSEQQIDVVYERLHSEGLKNQRLEQDMFDHFCCYIEQQMQQGETFEAAYRNAVIAIAPNGLKEIEFELYFIMNFKKQFTMKKLIFLTGFTSTFLLSTGIMFKTMRWTGANILLFVGFVTLLLAMVLLAVHATKFFHNQPRSLWLQIIAGITSLALIALGFMFKILQFPSANILYGLGTIMLNFAFLPLFFYRMYKSGFVKTRVNDAA